MQAAESLSHRVTKPQLQCSLSYCATSFSSLSWYAASLNVQPQLVASVGVQPQLICSLTQCAEPQCAEPQSSHRGLCKSQRIMQVTEDYASHRGSCKTEDHARHRGSCKLQRSMEVEEECTRKDEYHLLIFICKLIYLGFKNIQSQYIH